MKIIKLIMEIIEDCMQMCNGKPEEEEVLKNDYR